MTVGDLKRDAFNDVDRVDDIAQGLGHLAAMGIAHHRVEVHLLEGHLPCTTTPTTHIHTHMQQTCTLKRNTRMVGETQKQTDTTLQVTSPERRRHTHYRQTDEASD